jgi:t-SNARE complex subunit (syntaxin)
MPSPVLSQDQINSLLDALKKLDDLDAQIAAAEKAGLDVSTRKAQAAAHRDQTMKLLTTYAPQSIPKSKRS